MLHAVIMAGGSGTRFWPASRSQAPKQLLKLSGERTLLQSTFDRLSGLVPPERTWVITSRQLVPAVAEQLPELRPHTIVGEPCRRDTAGCIGLAAHLVAAEDPDATLVVLPSDHVIQPPLVFRQALNQAARLVADRPKAIVTFGITPTYPAESFGYIERSEPVAGAPSGTFQVARFREKPKGETAREYLQAGTFYWNSGIFVWRADTILSALAEHRPGVAGPLAKIGAAVGTPDFAAVLAHEFAAIEPISIDYAVLEKHPEVLVIAAPFVWDDVGSWQALARLSGRNSEGNTIRGRHVGVNTLGTLVHTSDQHLVATLGVKDLIIVHTPDATLVANKHDEESVRQLVKLLEERGWTDWL